MSVDLRAQLQKTLGDAYHLERELGGGGMSRVFMAEETRLKRKVAIKVLSPELAQGLSIDRFEREIQTAAALQQANIVPVLTAGDTEGLPYYTMPFVTGESLRARLGRGPLSIAEVVSVLRDVSKALAYAHRSGVVHRDIKPDNVLLSEGTAVVTDFGIAKAISAARTSSGGNATLTQIGTSIGTPAYMAPEQAAGDGDIDHRADIYSLGAMAYELLTGQVVFAGRTPQRMLAAHMSEAPKPVTELRPDTPDSLATLVMKCLAKEPGGRPQDANEMLRALDTTSGGGMAAMPPILIGGAGMFRKALATYAGAFVIVAVVAKAAIVGIGLPDWVFPGSLIVMALGLPVILWTGYVQRVTRRAMAQTPTFTPGGSRSTAAQGTIATMALKAAPHVSWYRTARGGVYAFGAFIVMIAAFMAMRAFGIGPFGSLIATGVLGERNALVIAEFTASNGDSALGRVVSEAVRAGLNDSRIFTILSPAEVAGALQRMQRDPKLAVGVDLARQIALREGAKAVVDGSVTPVGTSYVISARLVSADSGSELVSYRGTASNADAIIGVADDLTRKLRAKAGESLRRVQASVPLAYATTSSLEALRKYSEGSRANEVEIDRAKAVRLLRQAVQLDSNFAEAWRKLGVAMLNSGAFMPSAIDSVLERAKSLSGRLNDRERDMIEAYYYDRSSTHADRGKAIAAYERMLNRGDSAVGLNNLAIKLSSRREYARAETLYRAAVRRDPSFAVGYSNLLPALYGQGKLDEADSVIAVAKARFPGVSSFAFAEIAAARERGQVELARQRYDSARKAGDRRSPTQAIGNQITLSYATGRFSEARTLNLQAAAMDSARGASPQHARRLAFELSERALAGASTDAQLTELDAAIAAMKMESLPIADRPYFDFAGAYAVAGRVDKAKAILARYDAEARDSAFRTMNRPAYQAAAAVIAADERKWSEAIDLLRKSERLPDGPASGNPANEAGPLIWVWAQAGQADSAIAVYESYLKTPYGGRKRVGPDRNISGGIVEALAKMYDAKGNTERAVALYRDLVELWKNADPELQPRVAAAKERLKKLTPVEKPR